MINWKNFLNRPVKNNKIRYENISKFATAQIEWVVNLIMLTSEITAKWLQ